ncbi:MAG: FtsX-like permease family protein [Lachnospiraceae bacterium]|nr:FtsX-like permease family protein [Lachnospiraceae bacterium]
MVMIMVVGIKDAAKLAGIFIIVCCAVLVCTLFLNFHIDIAGIRDEIASQRVMLFYEAQVSTAKVVCSLCGGCLLITSVVMLVFYIKHYVDTHKRELGILKAMGYSNGKIAVHFWVFGSSVLAGAATGFAGAWIMMPAFYEVQNEDHILPEILPHFHFALFAALVILPAILFGIISILYANLKLNAPVLGLLKESWQIPAGKRKQKGVRRANAGNSESTEKAVKSAERPFLDELKRSTLRDKKTLVFFIVFASFCFSAMTQMSFSMNELASPMMAVMIMLIGIVLACTTLFLAITTVINGNKKTIAMMRVFGYSQKECCQSLLGGYRPMGYIGFVLGTVYQYLILKVAVYVIFKDIEGMPEYGFDFGAMLATLAAFLAIYETVMYCYSEKLKKISIKEVMLE